MSNMIMSDTAVFTNKSVILSASKSTKSIPVPPNITKSNKSVVQAARYLKQLQKNPLVSKEALSGPAP